MKKSALGLTLLIATLGNSALGQSGDDFTPDTTQYGYPDLQGVWNFASNTPMERPQRFGTQEFLTPEQVEAERTRIEAQRAAAEAAAAQRVVDPDAPEVGDDPGGYNDFWFESAGIGENVRTSLIVYPENGRYPATVEGVPRQFDTLGPDIPGTRPVRTLVGGIAKDGPEDRGLSERCIVSFNSGPPFTPSLYNNNLQIIQGRDTAVIMMEMIHDARIVPITDKPDLPAKLRSWSGDSRGWYEGDDTLVVQTRNFNGLRQTVNYAGLGSNYDAVLTERFTRVDYDTINYEFTVDDPSTYTDLITVTFPMTKVAGQIYEYACHEGNYGMVNLLRGARVEEQRAAAGQEQ